MPNPYAEDKGIALVASRKPDDGLRAVIKDLAASDHYQEKDTIMMLGRFRYSRRCHPHPGPQGQGQNTIPHCP